ncbi:MAG: type II toxin-antitoxin system RelE/ParE family toxin [Bacteroidota bacterium]
MIRSYKCNETKKISEGKVSTKLPLQMQRVARRKLRMLQDATILNDVRIPPANRLEKLSGDREGQHSIRISDQYRICFIWNDGDADDVEIIDYH